MDDRILALCEISNDLLYHKIPESRLPYYIDSSLKAGSNAAKKYAGANLEELYSQKNISIDYQDDGKGAFGVAYRGQITLSKEGSSLALFRSSIRQLADNSKDGKFPPISYELAKNIHLAHEFFHFLEYENDSFVSNMLNPITSFQLFGLKRRAHINRCSEVAAHAFAKKLLNVPVLPNFYDYLYLINTGAMKHEGLEAKFTECKNLLATADKHLPLPTNI